MFNVLSGGDGGHETKATRGMEDTSDEGNGGHKRTVMKPKPSQNQAKTKQNKT